MFLLILSLMKEICSFFSPIEQITVTLLQKFDNVFAIAKLPPIYFSVFSSLNTNKDSFPDLPTGSQKTYSSIIASPISNIFKSLNLLIAVSMCLKSIFFSFVLKNLFCGVLKLRLFLMSLEELYVSSFV